MGGGGGCRILPEAYIIVRLSWFIRQIRLLEERKKFYIYMHTCFVIKGWHPLQGQQAVQYSRYYRYMHWFRTLGQNKSSYCKETGEGWSGMEWGGVDWSIWNSQPMPLGGEQNRVHSTYTPLHPATHLGGGGGGGGLVMYGHNTPLKCINEMQH